MKTTSLLFITVFGLLSLQCTGQGFDAGRIRQHIRTLASDSLEGRGTGTAGEKLAIAYIQDQFRKIGLQPKGDGNGYTQKFTFKSGVHGTGSEGTSYNVVGYLDNKAPVTIIIGGHYDHLGLGMESGSLDANPQGKIHNGADDNGSGTSGVIELARYYQSNKIKEKANFLFICFSGEELGLLGSKHYADHPTIDFGTVNFMVNMDMIGRLDPKNGLSVSGSGTSALWEPMLKKLSTTEVPIKTDSSGMGPSDHTSFYLKNIPVLHFFSGTHSDYHKPSDDEPLINYGGELHILQYMVQLIQRTDDKGKLKFIKTKDDTNEESPRFKVTLGVVPDYGFESQGMRIDGVSDGKPAQKAGLKQGDVVIRIGEIPVVDMMSYMKALGKFNKGDKAIVVVLRGKEEVSVEVTF